MIKDKLLFLVPYGALPIYLFPAARLAQEMITNGYQIEWVKCSQGLFGCCPVHYTLKQSHTPASYQDDIIRISGFEGRVIYNQECTASVPCTPEDLRIFSYQNIPIGRLALFCMKHRLVTQPADELNLSDDDFKVWRAYVVTMVSIVDTLNRWICDLDPQSISIATLNMYYPVNSAVVYWCKQKGIPTINFNLGYSVSEVNESYSISRQPTDYWMSGLARYYEEHHNEIRYSPDEVGHVKKFLESAYGALDAKNYSSSRNWDLLKVREQIGLNRFANKFVVLALISSEDEIIGSELFFGQKFGDHKRAVFIDQKQWILNLMQTLSECSDLVLIIRPHPREVRYYPENWAWLKQHEKQYSNLIVNDQLDVSFYDLLDMIDLALVSISSAALDSMLVGTPVISFWPDQTPWPLPGEYTSFHSKAEYFELIKNLARENKKRTPALSEYSLGYLAFLIGGCNIYFEHQDFWKKNTGDSGLSRTEKEKKIKLDMPVLSYQDYSAKWSIKETELQKLRCFFDTGKEIHECRMQLQSEYHTLQATDIAQEFRRLYLGHSEKCQKESRPFNKSIPVFEPLE